jgi:predicted DNA binding protein
VVSVRCPSREAFEVVREAIAERYDYFRSLRLYREEASDDDGFGVTGPQREALLAALEAGYYDVPRGTTLAVVAESLGVSDQAVSTRLRRGTTALLRATLACENRP